MTDHDARFDSLQRHRRVYGRSNPADPTIAIRKNLTLGINHAALRLLGEPERLVLVYSEDRTLIGVSPAAIDDTDGYRVNRDKKGKKSGSIDVSTALRSLGVSVEAAVRVRPKQHRGGLFVDLSQTDAVIRRTHDGPTSKLS